MTAPAAANGNTQPNGAGAAPPAEIQQALNWDAANAKPPAGAPPAAKPPEGKPGEKPSETPPPAVELKWHEQVRVTEAGRTKFGELLKEHGLKPEQGQKYLDLVRDLQEEGDKEALAALDKRDAAAKAERIKATREHAEFGGAKFDESFAIARRAAKQFGGPELTELFKDSAYGDHPALFALLVRVGKALGEDAIGGDAPPASSKPKSTEQRLLDSMFTGPEAPKEGK